MFKSIPYLGTCLYPNLVLRYFDNDLKKLKNKKGEK